MAIPVKLTAIVIRHHIFTDCMRQHPLWEILNETVCIDSLSLRFIQTTKELRVLARYDVKIRCILPDNFITTTSLKNLNFPS